MDNVDISKFLPERDDAIKNLRTAVLLALIWAAAMIVFNLDWYTSGWSSLLSKAESIGTNLLSGAVVGAGFITSLKVVESLYYQLFGTAQFQGKPLHETPLVMAIKVLVLAFSLVIAGVFGLAMLPLSIFKLYTDGQAAQGHQPAEKPVPPKPNEEPK